MAIIGNLQTKAFREEDRTVNFIGTSLKGQAPQIVIERQRCLVPEDDESAFIAMPSATVRRTIAGDVLTETVKVKGLTYSVGEVMEVLAAMFDKFRQQDLDASADGAE